MGLFVSKDSCEQQGYVLLTKESCALALQSKRACAAQVNDDYLCGLRSPAFVLAHTPKGAGDMRLIGMATNAAVAIPAQDACIALNFANQSDVAIPTKAVSTVRVGTQKAFVARSATGEFKVLDPAPAYFFKIDPATDTADPAKDKVSVPSEAPFRCAVRAFTPIEAVRLKTETGESTVATNVEWFELPPSSSNATITAVLKNGSEAVLVVERATDAPATE